MTHAITRTILGFILAAGLATTALADVKPHVRGQRVRDFVRLTFEWPEPTLFTAKTEGNEVILTFDRKTSPNMGALLGQLHPYVKKAERKADGRTVVLTLDKPHRVRTFISDNVSGIDLLDVPPGVAQKKPPVIAVDQEALRLAALAPAAGEEAAPEKPAPENPDPEKPAAPPVISEEDPAAAPQPKPIDQPKETLPPESPQPEVTGNSEPTPAEPASTEPVPTKPEPTEPEPKSAEPTPAEPASTEPVPAEPAPTSTEPAPAEPEPAPPEPKSAEPVPADGGHIESSQATEKPEPLVSDKLVVSADPDAATIRLPLKERTALAVFIRHNMLWVVTDKKIAFNLSDFENLPKSVLGKASVIPHDKATVLRVPLEDSIHPKIKQQEGVMDIAILLSASKEEQENPLEVSVATEPPAPPHVFVPALEVGEVVEVEDPEVGDSVLIAPVFTREQGIPKARNYVDFSLLASAQGVVVVKRADATEITATRNGLRVGPPKGANVSPEAARDQDANLPKVASTDETLFPDQLWALEEGKSMKLTINGLFKKTVFGENDGAQNLARLRMAQLWLRDGLAVEALGALGNIKRTNPSYYRSAKLAAMSGAANFLLYRFSDAARDFGASELNNSPEAAYWRDMLADLLGNPQQNYDFLGMHANYISKYPAPFRQRLAIVAADRAVAAKEYNKALKIFDTLTKDNIIDPIQPYVDFLTARISVENGQEQEGMEVWKRLAEESSDKFVRARATFSAVLWQLDNNTINADQATDQLERLRLRWHGDGLELQIVQLLGDLYFEKQDFVNAMRVWQIGVTGFKNTGPAIEMGRKMSDVFVKLFNEGVADKMTPIEALSLYYEYRSYTPAGAIGTQMIEKLADRLVGVDLLSTAAQLLEQQMRTQMEKTERSRVGAKLAEIFMMNNQPKRAIKVLQDSAYGENPILLRIYRNQLAARSLLLTGKPDEALEVLGQDESLGAEKLRAMIYWEQKDWANISATIESIFKKRPEPSASLDIAEGEMLVRLALAYVFQGDTEQMQYLRDYFGPLMRGNEYKQAFDFISAPDVTPTTRNFDDVLQSLAKTRGFITNYKARLELAGTNFDLNKNQP